MTNAQKKLLEDSIHARNRMAITELVNREAMIEWCRKSEPLPPQRIDRGKQIIKEFMGRKLTTKLLW